MSNNVQEIIVYRNPLERDLYHALQGDDTGIIIFIMIVSAAVGILVMWLISEKFPFRGFIYRHAGLFGIAAWILTAYYMFHKIALA